MKLKKKKKFVELEFFEWNLSSIIFFFFFNKSRTRVLENFFISLISL